MMMSNKYRHLYIEILQKNIVEHFLKWSLSNQMYVNVYQLYLNVKSWGQNYISD